MSARRDIKTSLDALVTILRRRHGIAITIGLMRDLRDFGVECHELGALRVHRASTIPAPAIEPEVAPGDDSGRYSLQLRTGSETDD